MAMPAALQRNLALPAIAAPMFLISGPEMVIASCKAGVIGCFPAPNARTADILDQWMTQITGALSSDTTAAPWAVNLVVHRSNPRLPDDVASVVKYKPPLVITALGSPKAIVDQIHDYGGLVFADVINVAFARKAIEAGVDGLVLVSAGAGGHTGSISGFAFVEEVRKFWDGPIVLGGAISTGHAIRAAEILGADFAYLGTSLLACEESMAGEGYKQMVVDAGVEDIVASRAITGVRANWLEQSLLNSGYTKEDIAKTAKIDFDDANNDKKAWKTVWSAGQGVGAVNAREPLAAVIERLQQEYRAALARPSFDIKE